MKFLNKKKSLAFALAGFLSTSASAAHTISKV